MFRETLIVLFLFQHMRIGLCENTVVTNNNDGENYISAESFYITDITKTERGGFNHVRIGFKSRTPPLHVLYSDARIGLHPLKVVDNIHDRFVNITAKVPETRKHDNYNQFLFVMFLLEDSLRVSAQMNFNGGTDVIVDVPRMTLEVSPATFTDKNDANFDVTMKVDANQNDIFYDYGGCQLLLKNESHSQRVDRLFNNDHENLPVFVDIPRGEEEGNTRYGNWVKTLNIHSNIPDPRGIIELYAGVVFRCAECILSEVKWKVNVPFYNSLLHPGPYPEGFIGFIHNEYIPFPTRLVCDFYTSLSCKFRCEAVSNDPTNTELTKVSGNSEAHTVEQLNLSSGSWSVADVSFYEDISSAEGTYKCSARSEKGEVTMDINVNVIENARINREESTLSRLDDGVVLVKCIAEGRPAPNVTFDTSRFPSDVMYDVMVTPVDSFTNAAEIVIYNPQGLSVVTCTADNFPENSSPLFLMTIKEQKSFYLDADDESIDDATSFSDY